ncbi:MAG: SDR family oxidoreductase [Deltaproteobacteria bacterium]|nr:SDR family oxidoreductase [Deltaproteobacteria bacterium]
MDGQTVVVFGGSSGIGEATAAAARDEGARVVITGRNEVRLAVARDRLGPVEAVPVDATRREAVDAFFSGLGALDHLVVALGSSAGAGEFRTLPLEDLRAGLESKLLAHLQVAQVALPYLRRDGSITFISAISARATLPGTTGLAALNAGLEAAARVLALELAPLRVNAVSPGVIDTPWWDALPPDFKQGYFAQAQATLPVRRVGRPEDVGALIAFLMRDTFLTGSVYEVDGGQRLVAS